METQLASGSPTILKGVLTVILQARNARRRMNRLYTKLVQDNKAPSLSSSHDFSHVSSSSMLIENPSARSDLGSRLSNHMHNSHHRRPDLKSCSPPPRNTRSKPSQTSSSPYPDTRWIKAAQYDKENRNNRDSMSSHGRTGSREHVERVPHVEEKNAL